MMLLADVRVFLEIADAGSFTAAARTLKLPKSSVTRQLSRLETELGSRLIERTTRSLALTEAGRTFKPHARRLLDDGLAARHALGGDSEEPAGLLTLTAPAAFARSFLVPGLTAFRAQYPHLRVKLELSSTRVDIAKGEADIAVRLGPLIEANVGVRKLGDIDYWLVAAPGYLKDRPLIRSPSDLQAHHVIELHPPAVENHLDIFNGGEVHALDCIPDMEIDDPEAIKTLTLAQGGIAALPIFLVADEVWSGKLTRVLTDWAPAATPIHLLYPNRGALPLRMRAYLDFLSKTIGTELPWRIKEPAPRR